MTQRVKNQSTSVLIAKRAPVLSCRAGLCGTDVHINPRKRQQYLFDMHGDSIVWTDWRNGYETGIKPVLAYQAFAAIKCEVPDTTHRRLFERREFRRNITSSAAKVFSEFRSGAPSTLFVRRSKRCGAAILTYLS
jgi:hypothetical protein